MKAWFTKEKKDKLDLIKFKHLLCKRPCWEDEKTSYRSREKSLQTIYPTKEQDLEYTKKKFQNSTVNKQSIKIDKREEQRFHQREYTDGK